MGRYSGKTCRLIFMLVLTVGFFVAELVSGYLGNSIALVSDSFNMLSDLISLCVGLSTGRIARRSRRGPRATYGYSRAEAVGALSNAVFLTALCFTILVDSVLRLARPEPIDDAQLVLIVGTLGLAVNVVGLLVFQDWGACCRGRRPCPPAPAAAALRDVPGGIPNGGEDEAGDSPNDQKSPEEGSEKKKEKKSEALNIRADRLARVPGVSSLHEVHVWELASGRNIATLHIKCQTPSDYQGAAYQIRKVFHEAGVHSVTIQPEYADHKTSHLLCSSPCISKACDSHLCCSQREPPRAETNGYMEKSESSLSAQHKDNGTRKSDVEIPMEDPVAEENVKNCDASGDKSQSGSTRF
ncbi:zinc transporter 10 isoform X2 [Camarhynchus parvulus]|uniref:zinc transporter 10 isoform X2 n=1 Tax=Geospiza parvula TaxID=87175 RepID=UPI001237AA71|nr:zinc transporter 10 isoform X2 [Camarhynchus parvulus]